MVVTALVMAGGKASRMKSAVEKPTLRVCGKTMLERIIQALRKSTSVDRIIVAVTATTPVTALTARQLGVETLETPGDSYVSDMRYAVKQLGLRNVVVVSADIPFITSEIINEAVSRFELSGKPALSVMTPVDIYAKLGLPPHVIMNVRGNRLVPAGVNIINGTKIDLPRLDEEILLSDSEELALNVNTPLELQVARRRCER
jgi:adenosylcobinamide-phosphate guanylyltransferase